MFGIQIGNNFGLWRLLKRHGLEMKVGALGPGGPDDGGSGLDLISTERCQRMGGRLGSGPHRQARDGLGRHGWRG